MLMLHILHTHASGELCPFTSSQPPSNNFSIFPSLHVSLKIDQKEENEPSTSSNPVLELELTEEKLPMTLSRQEVRQYQIRAFI